MEGMKIRALLFFLLCTLLPDLIFGQSAALAPPPVAQFFDFNGRPAWGGSLYTCAAGTSCPGNPLATYTSSTAVTPQANPIILSASGFVPNGLWLSSGVAYKLVLQDHLGNAIWTQDNVTATSATNTGAQISAAIAAASAPNFVTNVNSTPAFTQGGTGAVSRSLLSKLGEAVSVKDFGAIGDGSTDNCTFITNALTAVESSHAALYFPAGTYLTSCQIDLDEKGGLMLFGDGGEGAHNTGNSSEILYTGTATMISMKSTGNIALKDLSFLTNNAAYSAIMLDMSHSPSNSDSALNLISHCMFLSLNGGLPSIVIDLNFVIDTTVEYSTILSGGVIGVQGAINYSNAINIIGNTFSNGAPNELLVGINDPGQAWVISGNTFEMTRPHGTALNWTAGHAVSQGCTLQSNWLGDVSPLTTEALINIRGAGWEVHGNYVAGNLGNNVDLAIGANTVGASITGNAFVNALSAINLDNTAAGVIVKGNNFYPLAGGYSAPPGTPGQVYVGGTPTPLSGELEYYNGIFGNTQVFGNTATTGNVSATGSSTVGTTLGVTGNATVGGTLTATGGLPALKVNTSVAVDGGGLKHKTFSPSCTTAATAGAQCSSTFSWATPFADNNYENVCIGEVPTGTPTLYLAGSTGSTVTLGVTSITAVASSFGFISCMAMHQ